jgi:Cys-tRNA(Pro) deacylase
VTEGLRGPADVEAALQMRGVPYRRIEVAEAARADQAARSLKVDLGAVVKTLLFLADGDPILVLVAGDRRVDPQRLRKVLGARRVMIASPERATQETGYPPGAVPPVGHPRPLPTWVDEGLSAHATVYVSGGAQNVMLALSFSDLLRATGGRLASIAIPTLPR